ncbi:MAG: VOC family protein [Acidimicrobiaceae bacterium]
MAIGKFLAAVMDCRDPLALSTFWKQILGGDVDSELATAEWVALSGVPGLGYLGFQKVPEKKAVKNRVHFDVEVKSIDDAVVPAIAIGARRVAGVVEEQTNYFQVMLDPEGNEFCFILRKNT